jgi:hypothetical protein
MESLLGMVLNFSVDVSGGKLQKTKISFAPATVGL